MDSLFNEINQEYLRASKKYPKFNSTHEGYAVLKEEVDELWDGVKANKGVKGNKYLRKEAIQVAAMAVRFIKDLCD
jgi:hypothetical protein